ncbi:MAG: alpha/beta fold hydrolase [Planctomycetes bacterium]|nr:alpha/beta fold hydrolase [Planctomycetota bacterium]
MFWSIVALIASLVFAIAPEAAPEKPESPPMLPKTFERHETKDRFGRTITYYIRAPLSETDKLPLVLYIGGSGAQSAWTRVQDRVVLNYGASVIAAAAKGKGRFVIVERPGVEFLGTVDQPGSAIGASETFCKEHTLDRWAEANRAAISDALSLPGVDPTRLLVSGHSEGGLVACRVAASEPRVTHVASAAGGGVTQLFDLLMLARAGEFCGGASGDDCAKTLLAGWEDVRKDPDSAEKFWLGHPYRRWSSFLASSPMEELAKTKARVYLAQGGKDRAVSPDSFHALHAQLVSRGRDVKADFVADADHSFARTDAGGERVEGWPALWGAILTWYFTDSSTAK